MRSPLQTLAAAAGVLERRRPHLDSRTATAVDLIVGEIDRFQTLVTQLLELARGDRPPERTDVALADLARQLCRSRQIDPAIVVVAAGEDGTWPVDRHRFQQILGNLLDNAERHGGGPVAVRVGHAAGTRFVEVDDEGPGVAPGDRPTIFAPFVRGRGASARGDTDGTGLGLALVHQHVTAHGRRVELPGRQP
jgi:signal transduction histidine kinase